MRERELGAVSELVVAAAAAAAAAAAVVAVVAAAAAAAAAEVAGIKNFLPRERKKMNRF